MSTLPTVLIVDDDENLTRIIAETLRAAGYEVNTAHSGVHGYSNYIQQRPEIVLTDIQMPELDGIEMMHCIRAINPDVRLSIPVGRSAPIESLWKRRVESTAPLC